VCADPRRIWAKKYHSKWNFFLDFHSVFGYTLCQVEENNKRENTMNTNDTIKNARLIQEGSDKAIDTTSYDTLRDLAVQAAKGNGDIATFTYYHEKSKTYQGRTVTPSGDQLHCWTFDR